MKPWLALPLLLAAPWARANFDAICLWLNAGFHSAHFDSNKGLRHANPGRGAEDQLDARGSLTGGGFPALIPVARWEGARLGLNVALVPPLQDRLYGALSFQLKLRMP